MNAGFLVSYFSKSAIRLRCMLLKIFLFSSMFLGGFFFFFSKYSCSIVTYINLDQANYLQLNQSAFDARYYITVVYNRVNFYLITTNPIHREVKTLCIHFHSNGSYNLFLPCDYHLIGYRILISQSNIELSLKTNYWRYRWLLTFAFSFVIWDVV